MSNKFSIHDIFVLSTKVFILQVYRQTLKQNVYSYVRTGKIVRIRCALCEVFFSQNNEMLCEKVLELINVSNTFISSFF